MPIQFKNSEMIKQKKKQKKKREQILGYFFLEICGESAWMKRLQYYKIWFRKWHFHISLPKYLRQFVK